MVTPYFPFMEMEREKKLENKLKELEEIIGYSFKNQHLLSHALTHSSYANEKHFRKNMDNERLEFLGDAVLEIVSSDFLYRNRSNRRYCAHV